MATIPTYISESDLRDVYPNIDKYDAKTIIHGWITDNTYFVAYDSGLVNSFFINGKDQDSGKQTIATTANTAINNGGGYTASDLTLVVDDGSALTDDTYIKIGNEILLITNISSNTLTVTRGHLGTTAKAIVDDASVFKHFQPSANGDWLYDSDNDFIIIKRASTPEDEMAESGEDWATHKTDIMAKASRFFDSLVDRTQPRSQWKDIEGNYDYTIIRTVALYTAFFLISAHNPDNPVSEAFKAEADNYIERINNGEIKLGFQVTQDSSQGVLREVTVNGNTELRPVDMEGVWYGGYDKIKLKVITGGAIGAGTYSVWVAGNDKLGIDEGSQVVTAQKITGQYQTLAGGLRVRFGSKDQADICTTDDEYEVEVFPHGQDIQDSGGMRSIDVYHS